MDGEELKEKNALCLSSSEEVPDENHEDTGSITTNKEEECRYGRVTGHETSSMTDVRHESTNEIVLTVSQQSTTNSQYSFGDRFTGQGIIEEPNPVYEDADGSWVTDLAYSRPLKMMTNSVIEGDDTTNAADIIPDLKENEFQPAEDCLKMFETEEKSYDGKDEVTEEELKTLAKKNGIPEDSWLVTDKLELSNFEDDLHKKISIGTFLSMGSEDMGSLEGRLASSRPVIFGHKVVSPPIDRKPRALARPPLTFLDCFSEDFMRDFKPLSDLALSYQMEPLRPSDPPAKKESDFKPISNPNQLLEDNESLKSSQQSATSAAAAHNSFDDQLDQSEESFLDKNIEAVENTSRMSSDSDIPSISRKESYDTEVGDSTYEDNAGAVSPIGDGSSLLDVSKFIEKIESHTGKETLEEMILRFSNSKWKDDSMISTTKSKESLLPANVPSIPGHEVSGRSSQKPQDSTDKIEDSISDEKYASSTEPINTDNQGFKVPQVPKMTRKKDEDSNTKSSISEVAYSSESTKDTRWPSYVGRNSSVSIEGEGEIPSMYFKTSESIGGRFSETSTADQSTYSPRLSQQSQIRSMAWSESKKEEEFVSKSTFRKLELSPGQATKRETPHEAKHSLTRTSSISSDVFDLPPPSPPPRIPSQVPFGGARPKIRDLGSYGRVQSSSTDDRFHPISFASASQPLSTLYTRAETTSHNYPGGVERSVVPSQTSSRQHASVSSHTTAMRPLRGVDDSHDMTMDDASFQQFGHHLVRGQEMRSISTQPPPESSTGRGSSLSSVQTTVTTKDLKLKPVIVDRAYVLPDVCCKGLTTQGRIMVKNPNPVSIRVETSMGDITVDGMVMDPNVIHIKEKFHLQPAECRELKVMFAPFNAGEHRCELNFNIAAPGAGNVYSVCSVTAHAELPQIEITCKGSTSSLSQLDFEAVPWGCQQTLTIQLQNKGKSIIPINAFITLPSQEESFYFADFMSNETNADVRVSTNVKFKLCPSKDTPLPLDTLPRDDTLIDVMPSIEQKLVLFFRAPDEGYTKAPSISMSGTLKVEVYKSSIHMPIFTIPLIVEVGSIKLRVNKRIIKLKNTHEEHNPRDGLALMNTGTITANVHLEMKSRSNYFSISPSHVMVEPNGKVDLTVTFNAAKLQKGTICEDRLNMKVRPSGQMFEVILNGEVVEDPQGSKLSIMSSHWSVFWSAAQMKVSGGIQVVTLCNRDKTMMKILLEIRGDKQFKLVASSERKIETIQNRIIILKPGSDFKVELQFEATEPRFYSAKLIICGKNTHGRYKIPLFGYAGESNLNLRGADISPTGQYITVAEENDGSFLAEVLLTNEGDRTCFVKAVMFKDVEGTLPLTEASASVLPNCFCLRERESQKVYITITRPDPENSLVGFVQFHYGDEINRQLHGRFLGGSSNMVGVDFSDNFANEESPTQAERQESDGLSDGNQFFSSIRTLSLIILSSSLNDTTYGHSIANIQAPAFQSTPLRPAPQVPQQQQQLTQPDVCGDEHSLVTFLQPFFGPNVLQNIQDVHVSSEEKDQIYHVLAQNMPNEQQKNLSFKSHDPHRLCINSPPIRGPHTQATIRHQCGATSTSIPPVRCLSGATNGRKDWIVKPKHLQLSLDGSDKMFSISNHCSETISFKIQTPLKFLNISNVSGDISSGCDIKISVSCHTQDIQKMGLVLPWTGSIRVVKTSGVPEDASNVKEVSLRITSGDETDEFELAD